MKYRINAGGTLWSFPDMKRLMAKATPLRSGDVLAGVAAQTAEESVAARMCLAEVPLKTFLSEVLIPYEDDEVTRLIIDSHDREAFSEIAHLTVGDFPRLSAFGENGLCHAFADRARHHAGNGSRRLQADAQPGPYSGGEKMPGGDTVSEYDRA